MNMSVRLRQATESDIPALVALLNLCYRGDPTGRLVGWTDESALIGGIRTTPTELERVIEDKSQYLFVYPKTIDGAETGELLGSISVGFLSHDGEKSKNSAIVGTFCVHPSLQGQGVGDTILSAAETFAARHLLSQGATQNTIQDTTQQDITQHNADKACILMYVIAQRAELIAFYERRGYRPTGKTMPFPDDGEHGKPKLPLHFIELKKHIDG